MHNYISWFRIMLTNFLHSIRTKHGRFLQIISTYICNDSCRIKLHTYTADKALSDNIHNNNIFADYELNIIGNV